MSSFSKLSFRHTLVLALVLSTAVALAFGMTASGQVAVPDIAGDWSLFATAQLPAGDAMLIAPDLCEWEGGGTLIQDGQNISSPEVLLHLTSGPPECPEEMAASLTGLLGSQAAVFPNAVMFQGMLNGGPNLGMLSFTGQVGPQGNLMTAGALRVTEGPFARSTGTWNAIRAGARIPTLGTVGLVLLIAFLLAASFWLLRQQQRRTV